MFKKIEINEKEGSLDCLIVFLFIKWIKVLECPNKNNEREMKYSDLIFPFLNNRKGFKLWEIKCI